MFKLDLEKAEEPEIKLPTFAESKKKQENSKKTKTKKKTSASLTMVKPLTVWITNGKILIEMGILDHLTCLLQNLYASQEALVRTASELGNEYIKAVYCHAAYLAYMQSISCEMSG